MPIDPRFLVNKSNVYEKANVSKKPNSDERGCASTARAKDVTKRVLTSVKIAKDDLRANVGVRRTHARTPHAFCYPDPVGISIAVCLSPGARTTRADPKLPAQPRPRPRPRASISPNGHDKHASAIRQPKERRRIAKRSGSPLPRQARLLE
ncbi:hypothetical protein J6590_046733 [Homalodisca vitripennis]|nr:hypothetical protein J6590_046733 [Homalodisca vitripennis]